MADLEVTVEQGKLRGCQLKTDNDFLYNAFLGIPYAKPPVGNLRFRVSEKIKIFKFIIL